MKNFDIFHIFPNSLILEVGQVVKHHMVIAPWIKMYDNIRKFYTQQNTATVMLDNGAFEGYVMEMDQVRSIADKVNARYVVLKDGYFFNNKKEYKRFLNQNVKSNTDILPVHTNDDITLAHEYDVIPGIPKTWKWERQLLVEKYAHLFGHIHCLGCDNPFEFFRLKEIAEDYGIYVTIDTSLVFKLTKLPSFDVERMYDISDADWIRRELKYALCMV